MQDPQFFWSEKARQDFCALFDDRDYSDRFRSGVAEALTRGWSGNRDKPFWALSQIVAALGEAERQGVFTSDGGTGDGLSLVWAPPDDLWAGLKSFASLDQDFQAGRIAHEDADLLIEAPDGRWKLSKMRLSILRKIAEFLLGCNDFAFAREIMELFAELSRAGLRDHDTVKSAARALSRIAYKYRSEHFKDGHSSSGFSTLKRFLAERGDYRIEDNVIFDFWTWPDNEKYKTYQSVFFAFADFYRSIEEAVTLSAATSATAIDDPAIQKDIAVPFIDPLDEEELAEHLSALGIDVSEDDLHSELIEPQNEQAMLAAISSSNLRLFKKSEMNLLEFIIQVGDFGRLCSLASLRLISFHPVQSGISNSLRTGMAKLPLHRRVDCEEAVPYGQIQNEVGALVDKAQSWLKVALSLRENIESTSEKAAEAREEGVLILKRSRSKSLAQDQDVIKAQLREVEPALIFAQQAAIHFSKSVVGRFGEPVNELLANQFGEDRPKFAEIFRQKYISDKEASEDTGEQQEQEAAGAGVEK